MRALRFDRFGSLENLRVAELPEPAPGDGEVVVRVRAASLNPSDVKNVLGKMEGTTLPRTPGRDFAGVVVRGPAALLGAEVWGSGGDIGYTRDGSHAEFIAVPEGGVNAKPARMSFEQAASVGVTFLAAWIGLVERARVQRDDAVLITGAAGGVGGAAAQIARAAGARVLGADRYPLGPERRVDEFVLLAEEGSGEALMDAARRFTEGRGVSLCFDTVGGPLFEPCLRSLAQGGRQVNIASTGERRVSFDLLDFYHRQISLMGVDTRAYDTVASARVLEQLRAGFEAGRYRPSPVAQKYRIEDARAAYEAVNAGKLRGKAVIAFEE